MNNSDVPFQVFIKKQGYSLTQQRQFVFDLLINQEPLTMSELISKTKNKIDRASVYRIIDLFEKLGIVQRLNIGWKYKIELSDKFADHHHHLSCQRCGRVIPINEKSLENFINQLVKQYNFSARSHQIEIQGLCGTCKENST